jgi:SM-20-related protein
MRSLGLIGKPLGEKFKVAISRLARRHANQGTNNATEAAIKPSISKCEDDVALELNPSLDRLQLAQTFLRTGRLHIPSILTDASAARLHYALERETPWGLIFNEGNRAREFKTVSPEEHQKMVMAAWERAPTSFQYIHHHYRLSERQKIYPRPDHYLRSLVAFLSAPHFCAFIRDVTGTDVNALQSSTATLFKPLHFLTIHDDHDHGNRRLVAFSLNMTPKWRPDWGGALQFFDRSDHVEEGYLPTFNALNLFRVPKLHSVSQVAAFGGMRYSVVGWFESGEAEPKLS